MPRNSQAKEIYLKKVIKTKIEQACNGRLERQKENPKVRAKLRFVPKIKI